MQELQSQFEAERNALLAKGDEARKKELEKLRSASAKEKAQLQEEMAKREAEFRQRMKELEESYAEAQRQRTEEEAAKNEELNSEIERLKVRYFLIHKFDKISVSGNYAQTEITPKRMLRPRRLR